MDFSVGQILVEINNQPFKNIIWSGIGGAIIGAIISGIFVWFIDNRSRNRWLLEVVTKQYVSDLVDAIQLTLETSNVVRNFLNSIDNSNGLYFHKNYYYKMNCLYKKLDEINTLTTDKLNKFMIFQNNILLHFKHSAVFIELFFRDIYFLCWSNFSDYKKYREELCEINNNLEISNEFAKVRCNNSFIHILDKIQGMRIQEKEINDQNSILIIVNFA